MSPGLILASLVGLAVLLAGSHLWAYRRGRKEGESKASEEFRKKFHKDIIHLVNNPNALFRVLKSKDKKD